jgi:peptidyl-prolyl cis-trans isomerase SDCCAG10
VSCFVLKKENEHSFLIYIKRQLNLLSFGEEAEEMEPVEKQEKQKMKSKYDFMENQTPLPDELTQPLEKQPQEKPLKEAQESDKPPVTELDVIKEKLKKKKQEEVQATPVKKPESKLDAIAKLKQDIRNISKVQEPKVVETIKEKKKSFVELEREKYANQTKKKKTKSDKVDDTDVRKPILETHFVCCKLTTVFFCM